MKKIISLCLLSVFLSSLIATPMFAQEVADILDKMIEARGGRKVLESIKDTTMSGFWEFTHIWIKKKVKTPISIPMKFYHKEPNKFRLDTERKGKKATMQAFDGETAWKINPQTGIAEEEFSEELQKLAPIQAFNFGNSALLHPEKYGITYTYQGKKNIEIEGKDYFVLEQMFSNGNKASLYVDPKTYLIFIVEAEWFMVFYDYKKVDGMMFAHSVSFIREQFYNLTFTEVKFNSGLEDSLFKRLIEDRKKIKKKEIPPKIPSPEVVIDSEFISKTLFIEKEQLGIISDITRGELDRNPGPEIGIVGSQGALLMDNTGKEVALVKFAGKVGHVDMIDVEGFMESASDVIGNKVSDEKTRTEIQNWVKAEGEKLWKNVELLMEEEEVPS